MKGMKAVIFDLGGVLVNYDGYDTFTAVSEMAGISMEEMYHFYQQHDRDFGTGRLSGLDYYQKLDKAYGISGSYEVFATAFCRNQQRNEPALAFARDLQARPDVKVGIISNTNEVHAHWLRTHLPEFQQFSSVILSNEVGLLKPDPAIFKLVLSQLNVPPAQAVFVDDAAENVAGGTAVGLAGIHHTNWQHSRSAIEEWLQI